VAILGEVRGAPVLTVGDGDTFPRRGGIVGLIIEDGRMRFAINPDAAQRSGVRLSSKLLSLARLVRD
jgi:YfiR/HmsC-like